MIIVSKARGRLTLLNDVNVVVVVVGVNEKTRGEESGATSIWREAHASQIMKYPDYELLSDVPAHATIFLKFHRGVVTQRRSNGSSKTKLRLMLMNASHHPHALPIYF